ncbi:hypothetical protein [Streptomyces syringium]|uniref:hypothetical protein n=1 Tax=Streptomyces syringium TaxID=76729 RepID=UPI0037D1DC29
MASPELDNEPQHTTDPSSAPAGSASRTALAARIALVVVLVAELMDVLDQSVVLASPLSSSPSAPPRPPCSG